MQRLRAIVVGHGQLLVAGVLCVLMVATWLLGRGHRDVQHWLICSLLIALVAEVVLPTPKNSA